MDLERVVLKVFLELTGVFSPSFQRHLLPQLGDEFNETSVK